MKCLAIVAVLLCSILTSAPVPVQHFRYRAYYAPLYGGYGAPGAYYGRYYRSYYAPRYYARPYVYSYPCAYGWGYPGYGYYRW
jgi:hypothetical protein